MVDTKCSRVSTVLKHGTNEVQKGFSQLKIHRSVRLCVFAMVVFCAGYQYCSAQDDGTRFGHALPGDIIVRHGKNMLGPPLLTAISKLTGGRLQMEDIPHIGLLLEGGKVFDLRVEKVKGRDHGKIYMADWNDTTRFKNPGFFSVLESTIPVKFRGKKLSFRELPPEVKTRVRDKVCDISTGYVGKDVGKYGAQSHCGDATIRVYDEALADLGIVVQRYKGPFAFSKDLPGMATKGLVDGKLRDWLVNDWFTAGSVMDPSETNDKLPRVGLLGVSSVDGDMLNRKPMAMANLARQGEAMADFEYKNLVSSLATPVVVDRRAAELCLETASMLEEAANYLDKDLDSKLLGNVKVLNNFSVALEKDIEMMAGDKFAVLRSHTLEQFGKFGLSKMPDIVELAKAKKMLPSSFELAPSFGEEEFVAGAARHIGSGTADIETITNYLDGLNQACWAVVGYMTTGTTEGAKLYQSVAGTGAKLLRAATQPLFDKGVTAWRGQGKILVEEWRILQERRVYDGLTVVPITDVYGKDLLMKNGLSKKHIEELDSTADDLNRKLVAMKRNLRVDKVVMTNPTKQEDLGGIDISPLPKRVGTEGEKTREEVLETRPPEETLFWSFTEPTGEK